MRAGLNGNAGQGLLGRGGEGLGHCQDSVTDAANGIAIIRCFFVQRFRKILTISCGHSQFCRVNLLRRSLASHRGAGGGVALIPLHRAGIGRCATHINCGVQCHALDRGINRGGHAGDGGLEDLGRGGGNLILEATCAAAILGQHKFRAAGGFGLEGDGHNGRRLVLGVVCCCPAEADGSSIICFLQSRLCLRTNPSGFAGFFFEAYIIGIFAICTHNGCTFKFFLIKFYIECEGAYGHGSVRNCDRYRITHMQGIHFPGRGANRHADVAARSQRRRGHQRE